MRATKIILASLAIGGSLSVKAQGAADLAGALMSMPDYISDAVFEVLLPSAQDPVTYDINLQSVSAPGDTLSPCDYLITWNTGTSAGQLSGFSAYYDGNHYRFRNNRLQEYHAEASLDPFLPQGPGSAALGVQSTVQFADMLPQFIGARIQAMLADSSYIYAFHPDTVIGGKHRVAIDGVKRGSGYDVMRYTYVFDRETLHPVYTEIESSPGSISEQIMTITYRPCVTQPVAINEESLMELWPEVFEKYRESTFKAENLVGTPLPAFACQVLGSDTRYAHHTGEVLDAPTVLVFLDPDVSTTGLTIDAVRQAVDMAPMDCRILWVFPGNRSDEIAAAVGQSRRGETTMISASQLVRNCGVTLYPTTIIVARNATVKDVMPGFNNDMAMIVLQKLMLVDN